MLLKAIPVPGSLMSPPCHQGRKEPSCLCSRASRLVGHHGALPGLSPCSPARGWDGPFCLPTEPPRFSITLAQSH